jgi:predicted GNAT family acetyltransferase
VAEIEIRDNPEQRRYEIREDGALAGFIQYRLRDGRITLAHTEIDESRTRRGLGGRLVRAALDDAQKRGLEVVPLCPFVAAVVREEPDRYLTAVVPSLRPRVVGDQQTPDG